MDCYARLRTDTDIERSTPGSTDGCGPLWTALDIYGSEGQGPSPLGRATEALAAQGPLAISHRVRSPLGVAGSRLGHESIRTGIADPQVMSPISEMSATWRNVRTAWSKPAFGSHYLAFFI